MWEIVLKNGYTKTIIKLNAFKTFFEDHKSEILVVSLLDEDGTYEKEVYHLW